MAALSGGPTFSSCAPSLGKVWIKDPYDPDYDQDGNDNMKHFSPSVSIRHTFFSRVLDTTCSSGSSFLYTKRKLVEPQSPVPYGDMTVRPVEAQSHD